MHVLKIATLNINGMTATTRVGMFMDFIHRQNLDIIFLQEITNPDKLQINGYTLHHNVGTNIRGTAILARNEMTLTNVHKLPSGRAISADYNGLKLINVYAPSGTARRTERESFFNTDLPPFLYTALSNTIIGGDFNCVLQPADTTGTLHTSRALADIVKRLQFIDTWTQDPLRPTYTHHHPTGATRIDRLYISHDLSQRKSGIEIVPAAFTDHHAVVLRITTQDCKIWKRPRRWKMDPTQLQDGNYKQKLRDNWLQWRNRKRHYPHVVMWWERCIKTQLQRFSRAEDRERGRNYRNMENHLHECLYDIIRSDFTEAKKYAELNRYKAKLVRLHATKKVKYLLDTSEHDRMDDEEPSLFHLLKTLRRRSTRTILKIQDPQGRVFTRQSEITNIFLNHLRHKYGHMNIDRDLFNTLHAQIRPIDTETAQSLEIPILPDEVLTAIRAGAKHKSPGIDGICHDFYMANWETVNLDLLELLNYMFLNKHITLRQKQGVIICLPKENGDGTPNGYRPISLLNTDYKMLARILARRLKLVLDDQLQHTQFCGVSGNSIIDAASQIRDIIAHADHTGTPLCVLSLDFHNAFDRIAHEYLFYILNSYGIPKGFLDCLRAMYTDVTSSVQVNDTLAGPIPIHCGVRQGCPLSMALYALCLHPLLSMLNHSLRGLLMGRRKRYQPVLAYADDVTIFVTHPEDFLKISTAITCFERATGALLNPHKSKAMAIGGWTAPATALGIKFYDSIKIFGVTFGQTLQHTMQHSWTGVIRGIREQARTAYARSLCLSQRIRYVQYCLLAKIWYIAQIVPQTTAQAQQVTTVSTWFIWQGAIFRIPVMSLHRPKEEGGWGFPNIHAKCRTLLYNRLQMMGERDRTVLSMQMDMLNLTHLMMNPPHVTQIPAKLPHIRQYARDMAYILPYNASDTRKTFKRRIYEVLNNMDRAKYGIQEPRIVRNNPGMPWRRICTNLRYPVVPEMVKSAWIAAIHDIVPTNDRLASIHLANPPPALGVEKLTSFNRI
jgi:exonuclease III